MPEAADLLLLQQKLRLCNTESKLGLLLVNESTKITPTETAILWLEADNDVKAVSGLPEPAKHVPFTDWAKEFCRELCESAGRNPTRVDKENTNPDLLDRWNEFLAAELLWVPLTTADRIIGGLLLSRQASWRDEELGILSYWGLAAGHAWEALKNTPIDQESWRSKVLKKQVLWAGLALVLLILFIPVNLTVNATAEVVPRNPDIVRAPIEGIIGEVHVKPNQSVEAGDLLLTFDDTAIRSNLDVVQQELAIANAEYQRATQAAVGDRRVASELPMLKARVEQKSARVKYNQEILERSRIYAQQPSIAVLASAQELEGRPVRIGEKIMTLAKSDSVELEFWLAVGDSIPVPEAALVELFLNVYPDRVHPATLRYISYQAEVSPDGILGFKGRANFEDMEGLRVGWRGTAKLTGERVFLGYLLFRRPLAVLRQWTGW